MDDGLPSYGQATTREYWSIVASFVCSSDLCSAALVCQKWNNIFMPLLWGNPASHFGKENDAVYVALVRFKRTLIWARSSTRDLTHTLHFPPAQAEIYDGPRSEWLSDILHRLPRLQSLIVSFIPFFDHGALSSLDRLSQPGPTRGISSTKYNLRLLDASDCANITPQVLSNALQLFPALVYLDLSGTRASRSRQVMAGLAYNPALQILKLQRLFINDDELFMLCKIVGCNIRTLDVRHNRITDRGVRVLIDACTSSNRGALSRTPSPSRQNGPKMQEILDSERQDGFVRTKLTTGFVSQLGMESTSGRGLTHIYISDNQLTAKSVSHLLKCKSLQVMDVGDVVTEVVEAHERRYERPPLQVTLHGAETLIPILEEYAERLTYLRIHHAVVTELGPQSDEKAFELGDTPSTHPRNAAELDVIENAIHEMPDQPKVELEAAPPTYAELEGSPLISVDDIRKRDDSRGPPPEIKRGPEFAPEPLSAIFPTLDSTGGLFSPISPLASVTESTAVLQPRSMDSSMSSPTPSIVPETLITNETSVQIPSRTLSVPAPRTHKRTYSGTINEHEARLRYRQSQPHALLPGTLNNIRTLVLTDVPSVSSVPTPSRRLTDFVRSCAEEEHWAALRASVSYSMPPGRDRRAAEKQHSLSLFPLRKIVLEMAAPDVAGRWRQHSDHASSSRMLSSTLDPDCETYLSAAKDDFSFFGAEECGQPDRDALPHVPLVALTQKFSVEPEEDMRGALVKEEAGYDVLAELSKFRKERKKRYDDAVARGDDGFVDGYWSGVIEVVRPRR